MVTLSSAYYEPGTYTYSSAFYSGTGYVELSTSLPSAANFDTALWANLISAYDYAAETGYGFSNVYWYGLDDSSAWPSETLVYRFQAVDVPRYSSGDTINLYWLSDQDTEHGHDAAFEVGGASSLTAALALSAVVANLF